eukprot:1493314-Ditylum_brightwellii.AAC.1
MELRQGMGGAIHPRLCTEGTDEVLAPPSKTAELPELSAEGKGRVQQVVGTLLFYSRQVDPTMLTALSSIAAEQNNGMASTAQAVAMLLHYTATNPDAKIKFRRSNMILHIHSDASYLSEKKA